MSQQTALTRTPACALPSIAGNPASIRKARFGRRLLTFLSALAIGGAVQAQSTANYTYTTAANASMASDLNGNSVDMSTGTTSLVSSLNDDIVSSVNSIGFDYYLYGNRFTQFAATSNGLVSLGSSAASSSSYTASGGSTTTPLLSAMTADLYVSSTGKVHYKLVGSAPNRCLVIEFLNMATMYNTSTSISYSTYQVRLYETTGVVEFVYGSMNKNSGAGCLTCTGQVGFSVGTSANQLASITTSTPANSYSTFSSNTYTTGTMTNLHSTADGSRRAFRYTPGATAAPTNLSFNTGSGSTTLSWTASSPITNVLKYAVYMSTDGITYTYNGTSAVGTNTYSVTGLSASTPYYFQVYAISEGARSSALSGTTTTNAPGTITANAVTGNWSSGSSWVGGAVPGSLDDVVIPNGATITIDAAAGNPTVKSLTIGGGASGNLVYNTGTAQTLTVSNDVTINFGASFKSAATGTVISHALSIGGNLSNSGTIDFSTNTNTAAATITFTGSSASTWTNSGTSSTNLKTASVTLNKGTSVSSTLTFTPGGAFTVQGSNANGFLNLSNGQFTISGTGTFSNPVFTSTGYSIGASTGFYLNNPNATVTGLAGTATLAGLLKISQGTFNIGTASGNSMTGSASTASFIMDGGTLTAAGRLALTGGTFNQSAGTINVSNIGNGSSNSGSFNFTGSSFTMSGGTINLIQASTATTPYDWNVVPTTALSITGGTLNVGTAATATNFNFRLTGYAPGFAIHNTNSKTATLIGTFYSYGNVVVNTGTTLNLGSNVFVMAGPTLTNGGTITATNTSSRLYFLGNGSAQTLAGSGTITSPVADISVDNPLGLTITHSNTIVTARVNLFRGLVTGSSKLTIGAGLTSSAAVQIGVASNSSTGGSFDATPSYNIGSGGYTLLYLTETAARTTGFEVPPSRSVSSLTVSNTYGVTLAGGSLSAGTVNLATNLTTSAGNMLIVTGTSTSSLLRTYSSTSGSSSGTTITVTSTTNLQLGMTVAVTAGTGAFAANTVVTAINSSTSFTVSAAPTTALSGATVAGTGGYVNGPMALTLPASLATGSTYVFPVGKSSYVPVELLNATTGAGGTVVVSAEAFDGNSGGSSTSVLASISSSRYWNLGVVSGGSNFTTGTLRLNDTRGSFDAIGRSSTQTGAYDLLGGNATTLATSSIATSAGALNSTNLAGYVLMATKASPSLSNLAITPSGTQCTNVARTVTVTVTPAAGAISTVLLSYSVNGGTLVNVSMSNTSGNDWSGTIPTITPSNGTVTWSVTATDANALSKSATGTSYSDEPLLGNTGTIAATLSTVCQNTATTLTASITKAGTVQLGTASTVNSSSSNLGVAYPTYYGNGRQQYLVLGSELQALGLKAGNISSLSFDVATPGVGNNLNSYTIKIGTTSATSISTFQTPTFSTVFGPSNITPVAGVNTHIFSTPFNWDGTSNLIVEVCFSNGTAGSTTTQNIMKQTSTSFASTVAYQVDNSTTTACTNTTVSVSGSMRPNMIFGGILGSSGLTYSWSNGSGSAGTGNPLTISPQSTTTYTATASDANGCSVTTSSKTITVNPTPTAPAGTSLSQCGTMVPLVSVTSTSGLSNPIFNWYLASTGGTAVQSGSSTTYTSTVSSTTTFYVSESTALGCESGRTAVTVTVNTPDPVSASSNGPICLGGNVALTATQTGSNNNYTYAWTSSNGSSGISGSLPGSPAQATPTATGTITYNLTATDATLNCVALSSVNVVVNANPVVSTAIASATAVCPGTSVNLTATIVGPGAGTATVGTGTSTLGTLSSTSNSALSPFSQYYEAQHTQYLVTAADLSAAGLTAGNLTGLSFDVIGANSTLAFSNYTIKIAHTSATSLSGQLSPTFTTVYGPSTYNAITSAGQNGFTFATPFAWNGTSNILVDVCFANDPSGSGGSLYSENSLVYGTTKSATVTYGYFVDNASLCGTTGSNNTSSAILPNMRFSGQVSSVNSTSSYNWTWNPGALAGASVTTNVPGTAGTYTYTATATNPTTTCSGSKSVAIVVGGPVTVGATSNLATICAGGSVNLSSTASGGTLPYTYSWKDGNNNVVAAASTATVSPASSTTYTLTVTDACGTTGTASVSVAVNPLPTVSISPLGTQNLCVASQQLTSSSNAATPSYQWLLSGAAISGSTSGTYSTGASGSYALKVTDGVTGCSNTSAATALNFQQFPGAITVTPTGGPLVCLGSAQTLTASASAASGATFGWTSGTQSQQNTSTTYPAPYSLGAGGGQRMQFLVLASELTAGGFSAGSSFSSIQFPVVSIGAQHPGALQGFKVSIGATSQTSLSTFQSGLTEVVAAGSFTPAVGYANTHTFSTPFVWDGSSNLIIETTFSNNTTGASGKGVVQYTTTTGFNSTIASVQSNVSAASMSVATTVTNGPTTTRPEFTLNAANPVLYSWSAAANGGLTLSQVTAAAANSSIAATPAATGSYTYTVTASFAGSSCSSTNTLSLNVISHSVAPSVLNKSASGSLCPGTNVILTQTGGSLGQGAYWQWYTDAGFTQTVGGQLTSANAQLTVAPAATTTYYLRAEGGTAPCSPIVAAASPLSVNVYTASAGGTLSSGQSICSGGTAASLTLSGSNGSIVWQSATDAAFTQNLTTYGSSAATLTGAEIGALTQSLYVRAVVTSGGGCSSANSNSVLLTVNSYPVVYNVQGSATYCNGIGSIVSLSNSEAGVSYQLVKDGVNQGAPVAGTGASLSFGVQPTGTYTVVASNASGCSRAMSGSAVLNAVGPFTASISAANNILCTTGSATMIHISGGPAMGTVSVSTNGGSSATYMLDNSGAASFPTGALNTNTTYTITAVSNGTCATATSIATTVYVGALMADPLSSPSVCAGSTVAPISFTGNFPAGTTYSWTSSSPAVGLSQASGSGTQLPSFVATNTTGATVSTAIAVRPNLSIEGCEVHTMVFYLSVRPLPVMNTAASQTICAGNPTAPVTFSSSEANTYYSWTNSAPAIGVGASGTNNIPSFTALNNSAQSTLLATFTVTPYANSCAGTPTTFTMTVNKAAASIAFPANPYCPSGVVVPQFAGTGGGVYSAPAGLVFNSTSTGEINLALSTPGTYMVSYTVGGTAGGCGGTATASLTILPRATVNNIPNQALCAGDMTALVQPSGTATSFAWSNLNPAVGLPASGTGAVPAFATVNATSGTVSAQVNVTPLGNGTTTCAGVAAAYRYTVYARPVVNPVSVSPYCRGVLTTPVTFSSATANSTYTWSNNNTSIGLAARGTGAVPSFTAANPLVGTSSTATVTVTPMANKCAGTPYTLVLTVADCATQAGDHSGSGVTARMADQVVVGPNPATSRVTVSYRGSDEGPFTVQLITQYGQAITKPATFTGSSYTMDLTGLTPGVYVLQFINPRTQQTVQKQIVKL